MPQTLPQLLKQRDTERLRRYADLLQFYRGWQWRRRRDVRQVRRELVVNYAKAFIAKTTSYMMQGLQFVADPLDDTPEAAARAFAAETALAQVAQQNRLASLDFDNELDCAVLGDAAYKVTWDAQQNRVRVSAPDVSSVWAWHRPDDPDEIWRVAHRYELPRDDARALYGLVSTRAKAEIVEEWTHDAYTLWLDGAVNNAGPNPYGFIPYVIYPNIREPKDLWGTSDIDIIRDTAEELNRVTTQLSLITELSGNPITVLEGVTESTDIGVQPGAVWELPPDSKAYLLDLLKSGGVRVVIEHANLIRQQMHDLAEAPVSAFGNNDRALSGVALNVALDPLVKKVERKRLIRGDVYTRRNEMILALLARFAGLDPLIAAHPTRVQWQNVLPNDYSADVADEAARVNAGLSSRVSSMKRLGDADPAAELDDWLAENERVVAAEPTQTPTPQKRSTT